jgi:pimeloyl-ACP methyl ester carboxylesterase
LAGSSWGSWLALLYAWRHPGQATALVLSGLPPWPIGGRQDHAPASSSRHYDTRTSQPGNVRERLEALEAAQQAYREALEAWMTARQDSMEAGVLPQPSWDSLTSLRHASNLDPRLAARFGESCPGAREAAHTSFRRGPSLQDLKTIAIPVLIIRGTRPNSVGDGAVGVMRLLPERILVTLMGAGHDPWFERPRQFFAHVERFLTRTIVLPAS